MIEAKELRIGNLIIEDGKIVDVWKITPDNIHASYQSGAGEQTPIPLTPEILDSCLHYDGTEWYLQDHTAWSIQEYGGRFGLAYGGDLSKETWIEYLHQLQNLYYALTKTELEVKL